MNRILSLLIVVATVGCAAVVPSAPTATPPPPAARAPAATPFAAGPWDDNRIEALLAYHARVTGYRTVCWETRTRRPVRCYDI